VTDHDIEPDPPLTEEQRVDVDRLTPSQVRAIDRALLSNTSTKWRKIAFIVGTTMCDEADALPNVPDVYLAERLRRLVNEGLLEAQGYLASMRYAEVRLRAARETADET
jgi:hypothetical protein